MLGKGDLCPDITKKFPILLEGILQDVFSQRAPSAWQGAQPQKLTVSMLLPGTSSAAEWRDLLQSRRQFWPTLTTRHASLVPVSAEALQRERRQMQAKHLWYNVDIRWVDLKDKLDVLAPTGLTRDDIWRHLFLTKQRKNPYEEGCYTGEDLEDVKRKWEAKKVYFSQYKKDGCSPPCIDLDTALQFFYFFLIAGCIGSLGYWQSLATRESNKQHQWYCVPEESQVPIHYDLSHHNLCMTEHMVH